MLNTTAWATGTIEFKKSPENVELIEGLTMEVKFPIKYTGYKVSG